MADQAATVDLPDEYTEEWGDKFALKAHEEAALHVAAVLYDVAAELKKQPVLRKQLRRTAAMINGLHLSRKFAFAEMKGGATEKQIIAEMIEGETGYPSPMASRGFGAAVIAEIVLGRERLERLWEEVTQTDAADQGTDPDMIIAPYQRAALQVHFCLFRAVTEGKVDATEAIRALVGEQTIDLNRTEYPEVPPADGAQYVDGLSDDPEVAAIEAEGVRRLAEVARNFVVQLPMSSGWRDAFIGVSDLDSPRRIAELDARLSGEKA